MDAQIITTIGLALDIVGASMLFFFGPPQPSFDEGISLGLEDATVLEDGKTVAQHNQETKRQKTMYVGISRFGLALIIIGFILQLIGVWIN